MSIIKVWKNKIITILSNHVINNKREYLIIIILFFIGLIAGVIFINNSNEQQLEEIKNCIENIINVAKQNGNINLFLVLKKIILFNIFLVFILWFGASTIIGNLIIYGIILFKGFSIGYTISSIMYYFGLGNGIIITILLFILHNIIYIPSIFAMCVSGINLYRYIFKEKNRNYIKIEILRHAILCLFMFIIILISLFIEVYVSNNLFIWFIRYI